MVRLFWVLVGVILQVTGSPYSRSENEDSPCAGRETSFGHVCVCNSSYCDTVSRPSPLPRGSYYRYTTSQDSPGFIRTTGSFSLGADVQDNATLVFAISPNMTRQTITGFGGAFTDSAARAVDSLPSGAQARLVESYYGASGLEYSMGRVPIASSDFSDRMYTYDNVSDDFDLEHFSLVEEDFKYKIPLIQQARAVSPRPLKLIGCPWSAPSWMKLNLDQRSGYIGSKYLDVWARYYIKFLDAYAQEGIDFWVVTGGNQVAFAYAIQGLFTVGMLALPDDHRQWLRDHLGPRLAASNHSQVRFAFLDDQSMFARYWISRFAQDPVASAMVEGVALHWYSDWEDADLMELELHSMFPGKQVMYTESSINTVIFGGVPVMPGSWHRGALYIYHIIQSLLRWTSVYLDWNLALDTEGGPYMWLPLDAAVIINSTSGEFYKNPIFYGLGHFSKFMPPGARVVQVQSNLNTSGSLRRPHVDPEELERFIGQRHGLSSDDPTTAKPTAIPPFPPMPPVKVPETVLCTASVNPDNSTTIIVFNSHDYDLNVTLVDDSLGSITTTVAAQSVNTFLYWP